MKPASRTWIAWSAAALAACAALALRDAMEEHLGAAADEVLTLSDPRTHAMWAAAYYAMWAALTPGVFALARHITFSRHRWLSPLAFHLLLSLIVSTCAPVALAIAYEAVVFRIPLPDAASLLMSCWTQLVTYRAVADSSLYWLILAAGVVLRTYDEDQARRRQSADLERALVSAELDALRMKLQPHFLFNTLNAINVLAVERDGAAVATTAERLGDLLRSSTQSDGRQLTTLGEELAWLDQYLAIEETRFGDRLQIVRRIEPTAKQALLPTLILQPIIENSIKHGFSRLIDASRLIITIGRDGDALVVSIEDDGPGLPAGWDLKTHCGRGLKNVVERLNRLYAGACGFNLTAASIRGTIATLRLPWQEQDWLPDSPRVPAAN